MIGNTWDLYLKETYKEQWFIDLVENIKKEYQNKTIYPEYNNIFNAFKLTDYNKLKVVILGQDPYHGPSEAHGLAFSVQDGIKLPPSLKNILKELEEDISIKTTNGDLTNWAKEGVLLLNTVLTVEKDKPLSHQNMGWQRFTDKVIEIANDSNQPLAFVLWGKKAQEKRILITNPKHKVLETSHPSPFSVRRGFSGSKPFSQINKFLAENNINKINFHN